MSSPTETILCPFCHHGLRYPGNEPKTGVLICSPGCLAKFGLETSIDLDRGLLHRKLACRERGGTPSGEVFALASLPFDP